MKVWFTSDLHLGHGNIIKFCGRPFMTPEEEAEVRKDPRGKFRLSAETVQRHDEGLIENINGCVDEKDILWILGDFCMGGLTEATDYRNQIKCRHVHLVWGNHDRRAVGSVFSSTIEQGLISVAGQKIFLNHYPMRSWDASFHGSWHLYGHVHANLQDDDAANDWMLTREVGVDANDYRPVSFEEIATFMEPRVARFKERRARFVQGGEDAVT